MKGTTVYEQRRVDLATFRALPASTWGHCSQVLCFTIVWDTHEKEKVAKWSPAPASILEGFNEIYVVYGPKKPLQNTGKTPILPNRPVFAPPTGHHLKQGTNCNSRARSTVRFSAIAVRRSDCQPARRSLRWEKPVSNGLSGGRRP